MKRFIVTRALPNGGKTATLASGMGLLAVPMPLQQLEPVEWQMPSGHFDALLIGSANAFLFPSPALEDIAELPVHAVGEQTAIMAEASGFEVASVGKGGLQVLLGGLPTDKPLRLLRVGGEERVPLSPPANIEIVECVSYRLVPCELTDGQAKLLRQPVCIALHSAATAKILRNNCSRLGINIANISIVALAPRIAEAAGTGWAEVLTASEPRDAALLELAKQVCNKP